MHFAYKRVFVNKCMLFCWPNHSLLGAFHLKVHMWPMTSIYIWHACLLAHGSSLSILFFDLCVSWAHHSVLFWWLGRSCHTLCINNQHYKICPFILLIHKVTYPATISACCGSHQATAEGYKCVLRASRVHFLLDSPVPGGIKMVKLDLAMQLILSAHCCFLKLNTMFRP